MVTLRRCLTVTTRLLATASILLVASAGISHAQCVPVSEQVPALERQLFADDPTLPLQSARNDNSKIDSKVTSYLVSDPDLLPVIRRLVAETPTANRRGIGWGLRHAEMQCLTPQPAYARKIRDFVRDLRDNAVLAGYVSVSEEPIPQYTIGKPAAPPPRPEGGKMFSGEWNTEIADPFASMPLPQ